MWFRWQLCAYIEYMGFIESLRIRISNIGSCRIRNLQNILPPKKELSYWSQAKLPFNYYCRTWSVTPILILCYARLIVKWENSRFRIDEGCLSSTESVQQNDVHVWEATLVLTLEFILRSFSFLWRVVHFYWQFSTAEIDMLSTPFSE